MKMEILKVKLLWSMKLKVERRYTKNIRVLQTKLFVKMYVKMCLSLLSFYCHKISFQKPRLKHNLTRIKIKRKPEMR